LHVKDLPKVSRNMLQIRSKDVIRPRFKQVEPLNYPRTQKTEKSHAENAEENQPTIPPNRAPLILALLCQRGVGGVNEEKPITSRRAAAKKAKWKRRLAA
jgi:hypothetical protein